MQRQVDGTPLYESLRAGTLTGGRLDATARALAGMHAVPLSVSRRHTWHDGLDVARAAIARSALSDDLRGRASQIAAILANTANVHPCAEGPAHRDFYDKQVLVTPDGVTLIDFDTTCASYRELDLANFVAHLMLRSLPGYVQLDRAGEYTRRFLEAYIAEAGALDPARYRATLATTWLRLSAVYAMRPLWHHLSRPLTDLAARAAQTECPTNPLLLTRTLFRARPLR